MRLAWESIIPYQIYDLESRNEMAPDSCVCSTNVREAWGTKIENSIEVCEFCSKLVLKISEDSSVAQSSTGNNPAPQNAGLISAPNLPGLPSIGGDIQLLIAAQNRTTHSVRAFVRFLFIQLSATSAAVVLWNFASAQVDPIACAQNGEHCSPIGALQTLAVIVWIIGVVWSSSAGWSELQKSEIPR